MEHATECAVCRKAVEGDTYFTEVNPPGGYGFPQVLVCDTCMASHPFANWLGRKWVNWPNEPRQLGNDD
jgi:hypothetical protein